ncbi:TetR/AcrR family transcriptional regulator [Brachybacterium muris]|uniref:TetR/AcrR family transcriptional regulator n=1 Tax=Brachybacterium muris TaxID=219301 RepID=UPI00223B3DF5|nr:TetR/AcrR family transcriptional regulator [Brachybacterium muris]MCT2177820.1 TetR/AcrR family transcriptional regulator [Brachybacterium muris]MCT2260652.1 TetR/AcrR family transcriptional regulator [Brachybacterium muris]
MTARDAVLDAYQAMLLEEGQRATTLEAVAARAGVSKGGLLYHFKSKEALAEGLIERLEALMAEDLEAMRSADDGPSRYYVRTSVWTDSALDRALVAVSQLAQESHREARATMARARDAWLALIREEVDSPAIAHAILLIGDGLYFDAALTGGSLSTEVAQVAVDELLPVVDHLLELGRG